MLKTRFSILSTRHLEKIQAAKLLFFIAGPGNLNRKGQQVSTPQGLGIFWVLVDTKSKKIKLLQNFQVPNLR